jgi:nitric oxide reductase NorD protein
MNDSELQHYREQLSCGFRDLDEFFPHCMEEALKILSPQGLKEYLDGAGLICKIGRGFEPVLVYLEEMPEVAQRLGESTLGLISQTVWSMSRTPNGKAITPFLQSIGEVSRRLGSEELLSGYIELMLDFMQRTTGSIHGFHQTIPSPGLPDFLNQAPLLLKNLSCAGLRNWIEYGIQNYSNHPERQKDYFSLQSADSRAVMQRERHGTLFMDHERKLDLYLRSLWQDHDHLVPYSSAFDELRKPMPYYDAYGIRVPDVYDDREEVHGIDRYRVLLAHIAGHRRWSEAMIADNYSPFQRVAIEHFEDARIDRLVMAEYPGLRQLLLSLHPRPDENACDPEKESCIRHRLAMFSYAALNPDHGYRNPDLLEFLQHFNEIMDGDHSTRAVADLALSYTARTRRQQDQSANVYFTDTEVDYRDDNRHLWRFIEEGDEEEMFEEKRKINPDEQESERLPPRLYREWDYKSKTYRPDWVSLYEHLHLTGDAGKIDRLLAKHEQLVKQLMRILDLLKPQQMVRVRYQEEGSELDLDVAIRSLIDYRAGAQPDPRINMSHRHDGRDIAVLLLLDLSASLNDVPDGCTQTILELSQEAVSLLGLAIDGLGDEFAIAGFSSNTRHEVYYQHIKGFGENWDDTVKGRLAAMEAGYSTRMGAALRHAGHYLGTRKAEKKLLLVLTDGEPSDIDVSDPKLLLEDSRKAVQELDQDGVYTYCINLDSRADEYVADIFGKQYTVIDKVERLPEQLPRLFMALTK